MRFLIFYGFNVTFVFSKVGPNIAVKSKNGRIKEPFFKCNFYNAISELSFNNKEKIYMWFLFYPYFKSSNYGKSCPSLHNG